MWLEMCNLASDYRQVGLTYGIGSCTANLTECLRTTAFSFDVVYLNADIYELKVVEKNGYREFFIPAFSGSTHSKLIPYCNMLPYLFKELFHVEDEFIFHFNYFFTDKLFADLKRTFNCKVLYQNKHDIFIIPPEIVAPLNKVEVAHFLNDNVISTEFQMSLEKKLEKAKALHYFVGSWY